MATLNGKVAVLSVGITAVCSINERCFCSTSGPKKAPGNECGGGGPRDDENPRKPPLCSGNLLSCDNFHVFVVDDTKISILVHLQRLYRQSLSELVVAVITIYREKGRRREGRELVKGEVELKTKVWHITRGGSIEE